MCTTFDLASPLERVLTRAGDYALYDAHRHEPGSEAYVVALTTLADVQEATADTLPPQLAASWRSAARTSRRWAGTTTSTAGSALERVVARVLDVEQTGLFAMVRVGALERLADAQEVVGSTLSGTLAEHYARTASANRREAEAILVEAQTPPWSA